MLSLIPTAAIHWALLERDHERKPPVLSSTATKPPPRMSRIVWMDMEMTGLDVKTNRIMEVCCVITNNDLDVLATGPQLILHHPQSTIDAMDDWCRNTHAKVCIESPINRFVFDSLSLY